MTREEALLKMIQGEKITRNNWLIDDFLFFDDTDFRFKDDGLNDAENNLVEEDGYEVYNG